MARHKTETLIIGAGISGLLAGKILSLAGKRVCIIDKSPGVGGRMATRRLNEGVFDHGAQFFTIRSKEFKPWVDSWIAKGIAQIWFENELQAIDGEESEKHYRYCGTSGMTSIAKDLKQGMDVRLNSPATAISRDGGYWSVITEDKEQYWSDQIILSAPVPQSLSLLQNGAVDLPEQVERALLGIKYKPCIAGLFLLAGPSAIPAPGGMKFKQGDIQWLGDNTQKGISPNETAVTIHAAFDFSQRNFDLADDELAKMLIRSAAPWLGQEIVDWQIHKWRYSMPAQLYPQQFFVPGLKGLYMIGDAFGGGRVEGAATSGMAAARHLLEKAA
jgi:renalase